MEKMMPHNDEPMPAEGLALASWVLLHVVLKHLADTGAVPAATRRELTDKALRIIEALPPGGDGGEMFRHARRLLEEWL